jgi:hypothetical protein
VQNRTIRGNVVRTFNFLLFLFIVKKRTARIFRFIILLFLGGSFKPPKERVQHRHTDSGASATKKEGGDYCPVTLQPQYIEDDPMEQTKNNH